MNVQPGGRVKLEDLPEGYKEYEVCIFTGVSHVLKRQIFSLKTRRELFDQIRKDIKKQRGYLTEGPDSLHWVHAQAIQQISVREVEQ